MLRPHPVNSAACPEGHQPQFSHRLENTREIVAGRAAGLSDDKIGFGAWIHGERGCTRLTWKRESHSKRSKIQAPRSREDPSFKIQWGRIGTLLIGAWILDLLWILDLGSWIFPRSLSAGWTIGGGFMQSSPLA